MLQINFSDFYGIILLLESDFSSASSLISAAVLFVAIILACVFLLISLIFIPFEILFLKAHSTGGKK